MLSTLDKIGFPHRREITAMVLAVLPLFLNISSYTTFNGQMTSYTDFIDVVLGIGLAIVTFNNLVFITEGEAKYKVIRIVLTVVLFALAAFHILGGLRMLIHLPYPLGYGV